MFNETITVMAEETLKECKNLSHGKQKKCLGSSKQTWSTFEWVHTKSRSSRSARTLKGNQLTIKGGNGWE